MPMLADYAALIARAEVYVLEAEGEVRGVLVLEPHPDHVLIENIAVSPQAQGMGYGKQMMLFSEAFTRAQGMNEIRLYTNVLMYENIARYKHWGYVETERRAEEGFARVFMRKQLT